MRNFLKFFAFLATVSTSVMLGTAATAEVEKIEFLGEVTFPTGTSFEGTELGGLSGITYDPTQKVYYSISDDRSERAPARFYTLKINLSQNALAGVDVVDVTTLLKPDGQPFEALSLDTEGIVFTKNNSLFISSEGDANRLINPFVNEFDLATGQQLQELPIL